MLIVCGPIGTILGRDVLIAFSLRKQVNKIRCHFCILKQVCWRNKKPKVIKLGCSRFKTCLPAYVTSAIFESAKRWAWNTRPTLAYNEGGREGEIKLLVSLQLCTKLTIAVNTDLDLRLLLVCSSSMIFWTNSCERMGNLGWWILLAAPSGGRAIFCTYGCGFGFSFMYSCFPSSWNHYFEL